MIRQLIVLSALCPVLLAAQPNIVIILADDLGYGDVGCYGATKIKTPNIDRLAREGARFTDAHSPASVCSPSRYGLMTGRSPWRLHRKGNDYNLEKDRMNIASMLKAQGYRSAAIGKWHLGYSKDWNALPITGPLEVGFDYHFGVPQNHNDRYRVFIENHDIVGRKSGEAFRIVEGRDFPEGVAQPRVEDLVDTMLTAKAIGFIRENAARPFFLYFTPCASHTHITPAEPFRGTSQAGLLGDHIQELDAHVGEILATLDELKLSERTLIFFSSDNGGTPNDFKGTQKVKINLASESGGVREKFRTAKRDAKAMGHLTNGPWHDGKGTPFEGGHRVPFIAPLARPDPCGVDFGAPRRPSRLICSSSVARSRDGRRRFKRRGWAASRSRSCMTARGSAGNTRSRGWCAWMRAKAAGKSRLGAGLASDEALVSSLRPLQGADGPHRDAFNTKKYGSPMPGRPMHGPPRFDLRRRRRFFARCSSLTSQAGR
jgi:hypothetical protein